MLRYNDVKLCIKSFDLVLFRGSDFVSDFISLLQKHKLEDDKLTPWSLEPGEFTHVGIILCNDVLEDLDEDKIYIWESTMSGPLGDGVKNIQGNAFLGVQLRDFSLVVENYLEGDSRIAIAHLDTESRRYVDKNFDTIRIIISNYFIMVNNTRYDANAYSLMSSVFPCLRKRREAIEKMFKTSGWMFCSELVANVYKIIGLIPGDVEAKNVLPMDFVGYDEDKEVPIIVNEPYYINF